MNSKKIVFVLFIGLIFATSSITIIFINLGNSNSDQLDINTPYISADIAGMNDVLITNISREVEISGYGIVTIEDTIEIQNNYVNPISSIYIGFLEMDSDKLIYYKATKSDRKTTLLVERSSLRSGEYEMIAIYFNSPLLPSQKKSIIFMQTVIDSVTYSALSGGNSHQLTYTGPVFPLLPYKADGSIISVYKASSNIASAEWGTIDGKTVLYNLDDKGLTYLEPFLGNLDENDKLITIQYIESTLTKLEVTNLNREIFISPWGIIRVTDEITITNNGEITKYSLNFKIPSLASSISVSDNFGQILGVQISGSDVTINFISSSAFNLNRPPLTPDSSFKFILKYNLPFEQYFSLNWFQESIHMNLHTTNFDYLVRDHSIHLKIDGCLSIDAITVPPDAIQSSQGTMRISYYSDYISPLEANIIQFTFTIDIFELLLRPIIFILSIIAISSAFVIINKTRKKMEGVEMITKEVIPKHEIREYCSLSEEKNALIIEIRATTEALKRKKITKKKYKNIIDKNTPKIEEIERELIPFKQSLIDIGPVFENIVRKIEFLDAERISIDDGLNLLEARYKEGKLPSRSSYQKLADNFLKRRRKIDRNYDKLIQQLRNYLL